MERLKQKNTKIPTLKNICMKPKTQRVQALHVKPHYSNFQFSRFEKFRVSESRFVNPTYKYQKYTIFATFSNTVESPPTNFLPNLLKFLCSIMRPPNYMLALS